MNLVEHLSFILILINLMLFYCSLFSKDMNLFNRLYVIGATIISSFCNLQRCIDSSKWSLKTNNSDDNYADNDDDDENVEDDDDNDNDKDKNYLSGTLPSGA